MIICHMVVGPGEAKRYLPQVLDRALLWADQLHVTLDVEAGHSEYDVAKSYATHVDRATTSFQDHEGRFRFEAWRLLELLEPSGEDFIVCLDADEVIVDHQIMDTAVREYPGHQILFQFHEMWTDTQFRTDGFWKPYNAGIMFPYRPGGHFVDRPLACGREPTYVANLPRSRVVGDILHYGYLKPEDRQYKYDRYMRLDGGKYHDLGHLKSIIAPPELVTWKKGGTLA